MSQNEYFLVYKKGMRSMEQVPKLTKKELEVMEVIWLSKKDSICLPEVAELLADKKIAYQSVSNYFQKLYRKGMLELYHRDGHKVYYKPIMTRERYNQGAITESLRKGYGSTLDGLIANFYGKDKLNEEKAKKLYQMLEDFMNEE